MRLIYNGIDMGVQDTHEYLMEPIYDPSGVDYLYTRHSIIVRAIVNGQAEILAGQLNPFRFGGGAGRAAFFRNGPFISYQYAARSGGQSPSDIPNSDGKSSSVPVPPDAVFGQFTNTPTSQLEASPGNDPFTVVRAVNTPSLTLRTIRQRLATPRGVLLIGEGGWNGPADVNYEIILESPSMIGGKRALCDCKNGPFPKVFGITQAFGDAQTFLVDFGIETFVNDSGVNGLPNKDSPLLSNRFSQIQGVDESSYTTITTEGMAIFRTDRLYAQLNSPDQFRPVLFMPIPPGFVRENIEVHGIPDVTGVEYRFTDRQVPVNFTAAPYVKAAKISAVHRQAIVSSTDILEGALTTYERVLGIAASQNFANPDRLNVNPGRRGVPRRSGPLPSAINRPPVAPPSAPGPGTAIKNFGPGMQPPMKLK